MHVLFNQVEKHLNHRPDSPSLPVIGFFVEVSDEGNELLCRATPSTSSGKKTTITQIRCIVYSNNLSNILENIYKNKLVSSCTGKPFKWRSQLFVLGKYPAGNILFSFSVLMAGASISKVLLVFKHMGLSAYEARTYYHRTGFSSLSYYTTGGHTQLH